MELDSELGTSDVQPLAGMGIYSKQVTCNGWSGGYHSNIRCERAGDGGGTCDFFLKTLPASHVLGRCGQKMQTLKTYSPGTRECSYFYVIHCIHASGVD